MNNTMNMLAKLMNGEMNPTTVFNILNNNPKMRIAKQMLKSGQNPQQIAQNLMKDMTEEQLQQIKKIAEEFGIKL